MNAEISAVCDRVFSALLNGTGQGLLLVAGVIGFLKLFRGTNAATRHAMGFATLALLVALPILHFALYSIDTSSLFDSQRSSLPSADLAQKASAIAEVPDDVNTWHNLPLPRYASIMLVATWCLIALTRFAFLGVQVLWLRALKCDGLNAPDSVRELFSRLCVELKVSRAPQLRVTDKVTTPMAVGFKEPAVLLPAGLCEGMNPSQLERILRHELAHVLRRDDWTNLFQQIARALFFFHPGVHWVSRNMTIDREIACDDHVLSALNDRKAYALSLTEFAGRKAHRELIAAPTAWSNATQLKQRIDMILDTKRKPSPRLGRTRAGLFATAAIIASALVFQAVPRLALAQPAAEPAPPAEPAEPLHVNVDARPAIAPVPAAAPATTVIAASEPVAIAGPARVKSRAKGDDDVERRLEKLERMVESLARRDAEKNEVRLHSRDKGHASVHFEDMAKMSEKIAKESQKAAQKATKDIHNKWAFEYQGSFSEDGTGWKAHRKALEEQKRALESQMRALERQIQKLERDQERFERDAARDEERRARDEEKRREKENRDQQENEKP